VIKSALVHMVEASPQNDFACASMFDLGSCVESASRRKQLFALLQQLLPSLLPFLVTVLLAVARSLTCPRNESIQRQLLHVHCLLCFCQGSSLFSIIPWY